MAKQIKFRGETLRDTKLNVMPRYATRSSCGRSRYAPHVGAKEAARKADPKQ